jgi:hypothetical protein
MIGFGIDWWLFKRPPAIYTGGKPEGERPCCGRSCCPMCGTPPVEDAATECARRGVMP